MRRSTNRLAAFPREKKATPRELTMGAAVEAHTHRN